MRSVSTRDHEIDMFGKGTLEQPLPGVAVEMEWNNKDPFFDRDLISYQALHREGALAVGVIVTRGPELQELIEATIGSKYGKSTTHWDKLIPKVDLGGGAECPLLLIGIEPGRITGISRAKDVMRRLIEAERFKENWRDSQDSWADAKVVYDQMRHDALILLQLSKGTRSATRRRIRSHVRSNSATVGVMSESASPLRPDVLPSPLPETPGGFKTVLADPPWRFDNRTGKVAPEHRRLDRYSTMTLDAIKGIPVASCIADNAHLYLWVPNSQLLNGLAVMEAWGFRYISNLVWVKRRKDGGPDGRGVGFYFRNVTELLLFGVHGRMRTLSPARRQVNVIETRKREHSRKPDEQYGLIEACSPGPRLELFARYPQDGWTVWGEESAESVAPRGKVHRGYTGGAMMVPALAPHQRLTPEDHHALAKKLRAEYERGTSIRDLAVQTGYSIARVRTLLADAGTTIRARGKHYSG